MVSVKNLLVLFFVVAFLISCQKEDSLVSCQSDTLRFIVSNKVKLKISYDSIGRVSALEPLTSTEPFSFRGIQLNEKAAFLYGSDGHLSEIKFPSAQYIKFSYSGNVVSKSVNLNYNSGVYESVSNPAGEIVSQNRVVRISVGVNYYDQIVPVRSFYYSNGNVVKIEAYAQDFNNLSRIATVYSYSFDSSINPLYSIFRLLSITEDPLLLSKNNCTKVQVDFSLRGVLPLGERINQLKYDSKGRLIYFKSGENEKDELYFSYCKE